LSTQDDEAEVAASTLDLAKISWPNAFRSTDSDSFARCLAHYTHFTCFTRTNVQILTLRWPNAFRSTDADLFARCRTKPLCH
jgi:hypothetical protein